MTEDPPRVFHLITRLLNGGAETALTQIVTQLDNYDFTVGHGASYDANRLNTLEAEGTSTKRFPLIRHYNPITALSAVFSVARFLRREQFDIVHTHSTEAGIIGRLAARLAGTPNVVHTIHGVPFAEDRNDLLNTFVEQCERLVASYTDQMVSISDMITNEYLSRGIGTAEQYRTIYYGIPVKKFAEAEPASDLPGERPRILMVGRLVEGKGLGVLLDAVELLEEPPTVLVAGDGPERKAFETEIAQRGLEKTIYPLGFRDDIPSVMAGSDILVLPSFREGTPLVIFEAMASGLPVVATEIAGIPDQVDEGETGYLVSTGDANALSTRLSDLIKDKTKREQFSSAAEQRANQFSVSQMVAETDDLYTTLLRS